MWGLRRTQVGDACKCVVAQAFQSQESLRFYYSFSVLRHNFLCLRSEAVNLVG